jgi:adenine phosphoribosyltransferase
VGREKYERFQGKKLCFVDDVVSTGGTVDAVLLMAKEIGFEVSVIACVLTEGEERTDYKGIPLISLGNIPLPGMIADN